MGRGYILLILFTFLCVVPKWSYGRPHVESRQSRLNQLISLYNSSLKNKKLKKNFKNQQSQIIQNFKTENATDYLLLIRNSFFEDGYIKVFSVKREDSSLLALIVEPFNLDIAEEGLQIYTATHLERGVDLIWLLDEVALAAKLESNNYLEEALLNIQYATDLKSQKMSTKRFLLRPQQNRWFMFDSFTGKNVREMFVEIWYRFTNGGIKSLELF
jgi:hypothetical protein